MVMIMPVLLLAQAQEANLLYNWNDTTLIVNNWPGGRYNEVWGVAINDLEIGIIGSTEGVHFIDVTDPTNSYEIESAFVPGLVQGANIVHRDYHDYNGYLYTVADEGPSSLQVIDMTHLPDTAILVYDSNEFIVKSHNIFVDAEAARLYSTGSAGVQVLSLEDPENPDLIASFPNDKLDIPYAHDLYVRGDTAYLNCGNSGLWAVDFTDLENPVLLGNMTIYEQQGYNHAGWMHETLPYYYLADETHGMDVKTVDVTDANDMFVVSTFDAESPAQTSIAHNLLVRGDYLYVSYYYDGVQVFDISDPVNPVRAYYYDTFDGPDNNGFKGAWGVYPYLPSGNIVVSDMQSGLFVFEAVDASITGTNFPEILTKEVSVWPQPVGNDFHIELTLEKSVSMVTVKMLDINGKTISSWEKTELSSGVNRFDMQLTGNIPAGVYYLTITSEEFVVTKKVMVQQK
jgi:choice-of-anchor B domain-containing protein